MNRDAKGKTYVKERDGQIRRSEILTLKNSLENIRASRWR